MLKSCCLVFAAALIALSAPTCDLAEGHVARTLLTAEDVDPSQLLPPPPVSGSDRAKAEVAELHRMESARTPDETAQAVKDGQTKSGAAFAGVFGAGFNLAALPATAKLLSDVRNEENAAAGRGKDFFQRERPWIVDPSLNSCDRNDDPRSSYPSGHATMAYSMAIVLAAAAPDHTHALLVRAAQYAESRMVCGQHFRSDIEAGQVLGSVVATDLLRDPKFRPEVDAARRELKAAHLTAG